MEKMILEGVELGFNDLSEQVQEKLYLQDKSRFQEDASKSQYASIRGLLIKDEECETSILDEIFKVETEIYGCMKILEMIWKHPKFEKTDEKRKKLAESDDENIVCIVARDEEISSEFLNEMLRREVQGDNYEEITEAIIQNSNFEIEEETIRVLANSDAWEDRLVAAKKETDSSRLNEMLRKEGQGEKDEDVIEAIIKNSNFEMEEVTIRLFANSGEWENRRIAAKKETDSSRLNEMFRRELEGQNDKDVKQAIRQNCNFIMEDNSIKAIVNSEDWRDRLLVARDKNVSEELLKEMYFSESDTDVREEIEDNLAEREFYKNVRLSFGQKAKIWRVLRKVRKSNHKDPLSKYLNEILEIVS